MKKVIIITLVALSVHAQAQFDLNTLKNIDLTEVSKQLQTNVVDKLLESHQEYDKESFNYAISFSDNAGLFEVNEKYEKSKYLLNQYRNAVLEDEKAPLEVASDYNKTGEIFLAAGKYHSAKSCFEKAISYFEQGGAQNSQEHLIAKSNLALSYHLSGRYNKATVLTNDILALRNQHEPNTAGYGVSLNNKGVLLKDLGQYSEAEQLLKQSISIIAQTKTKESTDYVIVLNNLSQLYQTLGQYDLAEEKLNEAIKIAALSMKEKSGNYTKLLINLALLYRDQEKFNEAEEIYLNTIATKKKRLGSNHPDYAHLTQGLASLYMQMGKYDEVEDLLLKAVKIYDRKFGKEHPLYATAISELGNFHLSQGSYGPADAFLRNASIIRNKKLGENHPDFIQSQEDLAVLRWKQGRIDQASQLFEMVINKSLHYIDVYFAPLSENEKLNFWKRVQPTLHTFYSFAADNHQSNQRIVDLVFKTHTKTKSLILVSYNQVKDAIANSKNQELISLYQEWLDKNENLARLYTYTKEELRDENIDLKLLEEEVNQIEKDLSVKSDVFQEGYSQKNNTTIAQLSQLLSTDEALVDIIEYQQFDTKFTEDEGYLYFIITQNGKGQIVVNKDGKDLNTKYYNFYVNAMKTKLDDNTSYKRYWQSVDEILSQAKTIYVIPDGVYSQINLNTLLKPTGKYLIDDQLIILANHNRDFIKIKSNKDYISAKSIFLMGNPDFTKGSPNGTRSQLSALPGTKVEIESIGKKAKAYGLKVTQYSGDNATEENAKHAKADILHIATHGYFLEDRALRNSEIVFGISTEKAKDNPLHRSGLLLSGAEKTISGNNQDHSTSDNGVLTAFEIKNQDYSGVQLAVLSACETGLGEVMVGEGVYGLLRAFQEAGVSSIVTSLWKVDDKASADLMTTLYANLFKTQKKETSFHDAVLSIKKKYPHPYYWGAFVLIDG